MKTKAPALSLALATALCAPAPDPQASDCVPTTAQLDAMATATVVAARPGLPNVSIAVKVADEAQERAAGFQHICPDSPHRSAIWFSFPRLTQTSFHMLNVHEPLDIAFMDETGLILEIRRMEPYTSFWNQGRLYGARAPFRYALETPAGWLSDLEIEPGTRLTLE